MTRREAIIRAKIYERVEIVDCGYKTPCHLWTGPTSGDGRGGGYPRMWLDGQTVAVHIVNWTNEHGYLPGKRQLDHLCRQRRCINDEHLEPVTHLENQLRRAAAARELKCEEVPNERSERTYREAASLGAAAYPMAAETG